MLEQNYLGKVRRALFERGVWGGDARHLLEQLSDHCKAASSDLQAEGMSAGAAECEAVAAMGSADVVAESAAATFRSRRWLVRHPWCLASAVFLATVTAWILILYAFFCVADRVSFNLHPVSVVAFETLKIILVLGNWLPFTGGVAWLFWWTRRSPGSWKAVLLAGIALGMATSFYDVKFQGSTSGGFMYIESQTWLNVACRIAAMMFVRVRIFMTGSAARNPGFYPHFSFGALLRFTLPVAVIWCARYLAPSRQVDRDFCG